MKSYFRVKNFISIGSVFFALNFLVDSIIAETTNVVATKDNTIYADSDFSNGSGDHFFVGVNGVGIVRRSLIAFDLANVLPAGALVTNVALQLNASQVAADPRVVSVHRLIADWGEGASDAPGGEGGGTNASIGDATWTNSFFNTVLWTNLGGDFIPTPSATNLVDAIAQYTWSSPEMLNDVNLWLTNATTNFGWILIGDESMNTTSKRFDSRTNPIATNRPILIVSYSNTSPAINNTTNTVTISAIPTTILEGNSSVVTISRQGSGITNPLTVFYSTSGTASTNDFVLNPVSSIFLPANVTSTNLTLFATTNNPPGTSNNGTVTVSITPDANYGISNGNVTITILPSGAFLPGTPVLAGVTFDKLIPKDGKKLSFKIAKGFKAKGRLVRSDASGTNTFSGDIYAFFKSGEGTNANQTAPTKLVQKPTIPKKLAKKGVLAISKSDKSTRVGVGANPVNKDTAVQVVFFASNSSGILYKTNNLTAKNIK